MRFPLFNILDSFEFQMRFAVVAETYFVFFLGGGGIVCIIFVYVKVFIFILFIYLLFWDKWIWAKAREKNVTSHRSSSIWVWDFRLEGKLKYQVVEIYTRYSYHWKPQKMKAWSSLLVIIFAIFEICNYIVCFPVVRLSFRLIFDTLFSLFRLCLFQQLLDFIIFHWYYSAVRNNVCL